MDKRSSIYMAEEPRVYWLSNQMPCRTPIGAALQGMCCGRVGHKTHGAQG